MKKINLLLCFALIFLAGSFQLTSATVTEQNNFREAYYDLNKNLVKTNNPVNGVNTIAFVCADSACSSFSKIQWTSSTIGNSIIFNYPTNLVYPYYGYAIYIYKDGYIPFEKYSNYFGDGLAPAFTDYLSKIESCTSSITDLDAQVSGQTVNVNLIVDSPIINSGILNPIPSQLTSQYSTAVDVNLEIKDSSGNTVYTETKQKTIQFSGTSSVSFSKTLSPGDYTVRVYTSLDNEAKCLSYNPDSKTKTVHIDEPDTNPVIDSVNANPTSGKEPLTVDFSCSASGGNGQLSFSWAFGDGQTSNSQNPTHTYLDFGSYTATCTATDSDGDSDSGTVNINVIEDKMPVIDSISANPNSGVVPLDVQFSCTASNGDGTLTYHWDFGDGETTNMQNPTHTYTNVGSYTATCRVEDSDGDSDSATVDINVRKDTLEITDLTCFENVIENNNQSCSIYVKNSLGNPVSDAEVKVYYSDNSLFGTCNTNSISGGCVVKDLQETVGDFTLYATATKGGFNGDLDKNPKFSYTVLQEKYNITDLKVYNDLDFLNEDYDFFRGEGLYVSFKVIGDNGPAQDMVTKATLVSLPGGRVDLEEIENHNGEYFYKLNSIPLTHDFFGDSNIFAFAFNFTDGSGGQSEVSLIIRNNLPTIKNIDDKSVYEGKEITIDLEDYENDLEDSGDDLRWEVIENSSNFDAEINGKILTIKGINKGEGELTLRLYDLDKDYAETNITITVKKKSNGGGGGGGGSNNIIGHKEVIEPSPLSGGIGYFIEEEPQKEIEDSAFVKFLKAGYGLLLMLLLLLILLVLLIIVMISKKKK